MSSLACKCLFHRLERNVNFEDLEMQKWNIPTDRGGRVDEENGAICIIIMSTPRIMVIKMSKMALCFVFSAEDSRKSVTVWAKY